MLICFSIITIIVAAVLPLLLACAAPKPPPKPEPVKEKPAGPVFKLEGAGEQKIVKKRMNAEPEGAPSMSSEMKPRRETEKGTRIKDIKEGVKIMEDGESDYATVQENSDSEKIWEQSDRTRQSSNARKKHKKGPKSEAPTPKALAGKPSSAPAQSSQPAK